LEWFLLKDIHIKNKVNLQYNSKFIRGTKIQPFFLLETTQLMIINNGEDITKCVLTRLSLHKAPCFKFHNETDLINALPVNRSVNEVQPTTEEAVFTVDLTDAAIDWVHSDHMICVYCRSMSVPWLYK
jgi:hypothetical protein